MEVNMDKENYTPRTQNDRIQLEILENLKEINKVLKTINKSSVPKKREVK